MMRWRAEAAGQRRARNRRAASAAVRMMRWTSPSPFTTGRECVTAGRSAMAHDSERPFSQDALCRFRLKSLGASTIYSGCKGHFRPRKGDTHGQLARPANDRRDAATVGVPRAARDAGLRSYMLSVYNYMASGVLLTGIVALLFAPYAGQVLIQPDGRGMSLLGWVVTLSPLGDRVRDELRRSAACATGTLQLLFWGFAALMGLSMSTLVPGLYRDVDRADLLRDRGGLPRPQPLRLHDQARPRRASARS